MIDVQRKSEAREAILKSIRDHLALSAGHDIVYSETRVAHHAIEAIGASPLEIGEEINPNNNDPVSALDLFKQNLEAVEGHCLVVHGDAEITGAITRIVAHLQATPFGARRIALSDSPAVERLSRPIQVDVDEIAVGPEPDALFGYDVGITTAQAAIAETGTLVLESERERHRLVSLVPPVHIALLNASSICLNLREALENLRPNASADLSQTVTFVTGPSRTADIELTLAIGVHGPRELYVIVNEDV